ncbi:unnamed protein product [Symbiodinium natans]|uniref:Uncharacterized protein n=1 Tax=Symbiodinium natans TaxID=878477 RepID=A0A812PS43_9DINO|nr:unnamed protein product [Symbiodinium natans]
MCARKVRWSCQKVVGLGSCTQKSSSVERQQDVEALKLVEVDCGQGAVMNKLTIQTNPGDFMIKLVAQCCTAVATPVVTRPYRMFRRQPDVNVFSGIYCPASDIDASGRQAFVKNRTLLEASGWLQHRLMYDRGEGRWCLNAGQSKQWMCSGADVVHPLDLGSALEFRKLDAAQNLPPVVVVPMTNFDGEFLGSGVLKNRGTSSGAKPQLLTFSATQPDYAEECQDRYTPGSWGI